MIQEKFSAVFRLLLCICAIQSCSAEEAAVPMIPREILFGNPEKTTPTLSPDGTKLAYLAPDANGVLNVWMHDLSAAKEVELITADKKRGIRFYCWGYDGSHILYVQDRDGDENWHLYQTNLQTKQTRDLTPFDGAVAGIVALEPLFAKEILVQLNVRNPALFDVYRINLESGNCEMAVENTHNEFQWLADNSLQVRASCAFDRNGDCVIRVRTDLQSPWRELMRWSPEENGHLLSFSADGHSLYVATSKGANTVRLLQVHIADGSERVVAEDPHYDLYGSHVMIHPVSREIEAIRVNRERQEWIVLDARIAGDFEALQRPNEEMEVFSRDAADQQWIVRYSSDIHPDHFYLYLRANKESRFLFSTKPQLEPYSHSAMTPISFTARDGMELYGYLTLPSGIAPKNLPTVLLVHGGPWARDSWGYHRLNQWLSNRGYAVLQVNFRGSLGYGKSYLNAGNREWAGKMHTDLLDGKRWIIEKGIGNPEKMAIVGGSYGGYAALVGLAFTPEEFSCGIDLVGPSNLVSLIETVPPYWGPFRPIFDLRVGNVDTEKDFLKSRSPLFLADRICRPLLIAQGANDPRVKQAESDQIVNAMRQNGQEVQYLLIPDEGHGFARPENNLQFAEAAERFLHKHLGGRLQE